MEFLKLVGEVGFPIAAAIASSYFVFLALKFILAGVTSSVKSLSNIIVSLESRVTAMNNDLIKIDTKISHILDLEPDIERISRSEQSDSRRD